MSRALLVHLVFVIGCGAPAADPDAGAAPPDASGELDAGWLDAGWLDAGAPSDAGGGEPDGGPTSSGSVEWSPELENPYELTLTDPIALDYFLQYSVVLPVPNQPAAMVRIVICQQPASASSPSCTNSDLVASEGTAGLRYGIDPSSYEEGENLYTFTLRLFSRGELVSEHVLEWRVTYAPSGG